MLTTLPIPTHTCQLITTGKDIGVGTFNAKCYYSSTVSFSVLHFCVPENIIAEIFLPSNLFSIQRTNANAHISMNFERRMRGIKLQRYLFSSPFSDTCDLVAWTKFTCTYVCICGSLLASGRDLSTSMLLFLDDMDCLLHFMLACRDVANYISRF